MRRDASIVAGLAALLTALPAYRPTALFAQQPGVDVLRYTFTITLPDTGNTITGQAEIELVRTGRVDTVEIDLVGMDVVRVGARTVRPEEFTDSAMPAVPYSYDGRVIRVPMAPREASRVERIVVSYRGVPSDGLIIRANARGRRSFFGDDWPNRARYWLPTVDHPSDKAAVTWVIDAPESLAVVANGLCRREGRRTVCREERPIPTYTFVLGAAPMMVSRHRPAIVGRDTIPIEVWAYPEDSAFADSVPFRRATEIVETMSRIAGPFPYAKLAHVESATRYGGMENATAIFYAESPYVRRTMREAVVRHETAHQWFGDAVTERDWHHLWLSEGFASYFDLVIGAALDGDSVLIRGMRRNAQGWMRSDVIDHPVIDTAESDPNRLLNANVYPKGAWVLHMLRAQVGDSAFFRGVRDYYRSYRDSSVITAQFQREMERATRQDLGWFFHQWLWQPGYPQLEVRWTADSLSRSVTCYIRQAQPEAWGRYRLPRVPVALVMPEGAVERRWFGVDPRYQEQVATFMLTGPMPQQIVVDPDGTLLLTAAVRN